MILHTKTGHTIKGKFLNKNRNSVVVETDDGPRAVGVEQLKSVEVQSTDKAGSDERGKPVKASDAQNLNWPGR